MDRWINMKAAGFVSGACLLWPNFLEFTGLLLAGCISHPHLSSDFLSQRFRKWSSCRPFHYFKQNKPHIPILISSLNSAYSCYSWDIQLMDEITTTWIITTVLARLWKKKFIALFNMQCTYFLQKCPQWKEHEHFHIKFVIIMPKLCPARSGGIHITYPALLESIHNFPIKK